MTADTDSEDAVYIFKMRNKEVLLYSCTKDTKTIKYIDSYGFSDDDRNYTKGDHHYLIAFRDAPAPEDQSLAVCGIQLT